MPIYVYRCAGGHTFEKLCNIEDRHNAVCPMCKHEVRLLISETTFRMAVPFTVQDSKGNVIQQRQVVDNTPPIGYKNDEHNRVEI